MIAVPIIGGMSLIEWAIGGVLAFIILAIPFGGCIFVLWKVSEWYKVRMGHIYTASGKILRRKK